MTIVKSHIGKVSGWFPPSESRKCHWLCGTYVVLMNRKIIEHLLYETRHNEKKKSQFCKIIFHKMQLHLCCRWAQSANRKTITGNIWCEVGQPGHSWLNIILFTCFLSSFQMLFNTGKHVQVSVFPWFSDCPMSTKMSVHRPRGVPDFSRTRANLTELGRKSGWDGMIGKRGSSCWHLRSPADPGWALQTGRNAATNVQRFHPNWVVVRPGSLVVSVPSKLCCRT